MLLKEIPPFLCQNFNTDQCVPEEDSERILNIFNEGGDEYLKFRNKRFVTNNLLPSFERKLKQLDNNW